MAGGAGGGKEWQLIIFTAETTDGRDDNAATELLGLGPAPSSLVTFQSAGPPGCEASQSG